MYYNKNILRLEGKLILISERFKMNWIKNWIILSDWVLKMIDC